MQLRLALLLALDLLGAGAVGHGGSGGSGGRSKLLFLARLLALVVPLVLQLLPRLLARGAVAGGLASHPKADVPLALHLAPELLEERAVGIRRFGDILGGNGLPLESLAGEADGLSDRDPIRGSDEHAGVADRPKDRGLVARRRRALGHRRGDGDGLHLPPRQRERENRGRGDRLPPVRLAREVAKRVHHQALSLDRVVRRRRHLVIRPFIVALRVPSEAISCSDRVIVAINPFPSSAPSKERLGVVDRRRVVAPIDQAEKQVHQVIVSVHHCKASDRQPLH